MHSKYGYFEIFDELSENPTKSEVYELLLNSPNNLIMEAATMFIEQTDQNPILSTLRK